MKYLAILCLLVALPSAAAASKKDERKAKAAKSKAEKSEPAAAEESGWGESGGKMTAEEFESQLDYQHGKITLPGGIATLDVPDTFRYLAPAQADRILVEAWGNPPGTKTLGMIFPADVSPLAEEGWGVVISYVEDGHVSDADAKDINYNDLLKGMKEATAEDNKERRKQGYEPITLVGWAAPPHYDQSSRKLYWAKELQFEGAPANTLNYDVRVLGRKGVLSFNAVAVMSQLPRVEAGMKEVMNFAEFNPGHRYADFDSKVDDVAAYGVGALVAGKIAAKAGLFKVVLGLLAASKKFLIIGVIALGVLAKKLFSRKSAA